MNPTALFAMIGVLSAGEFGALRKGVIGSHSVAGFAVVAVERAEFAAVMGSRHEEKRPHGTLHRSQGAHQPPFGYFDL